jgi:hypothetical protein
MDLADPMNHPTPSAHAARQTISHTIATTLRGWLVFPGHRQ